MRATETLQRMSGSFISAVKSAAQAPLQRPSGTFDARGVAFFAKNIALIIN
jgi:hypothetical protein